MDWHSQWPYHIQPPHIPHLEQLDDLRANSPILWLMVTGTTSSRIMARRLAWPHALILNTLRSYKQRGLIYDYYTSSRMAWIFCPDSEYEPLIQFVRTMRDTLSRPDYGVEEPEDDYYASLPPRPEGATDLDTSTGS